LGSQGQEAFRSSIITSLKNFFVFAIMGNDQIVTGITMLQRREGVFTTFLTM
jgi:hypothetical protein